MSVFRFLKLAIQKIIEPAEDPSKTGRVSIFESYNQLQKELDRVLNRVKKGRQQLKKKSQLLRGRALNIVSKAKLALDADNEELAQIALCRSQIIMHEVENLNQKILEIDREIERLVLIQHRLKTRIEIYRTRHDILSANQIAAEVHIAAGKAVKEIAKDSEELDQTFELAEKSKKDMLALGEDIKELLGPGNFGGLSIS